MRELNDPIGRNQNSRAKLKQRLAGGAVLLIVLAIFLPFIFNHSHPGATLPAESNAPPAEPAVAPAPANTNPVNSNVDAAAPPAAPLADTTLSSDQPGLTPAQNESAALPEAPVTQAQPVVEQQPAAQPSVEQPSIVQPVAEQPEMIAPQAPPVERAVAEQPSATLPPPVRTTASKSLPSPAKSLNPTALRGGWIIQVGSFSQPEYAQQLATRLRAGGLTVYTKRGANQMTRVYIGPLATQQQAQKIQDKVQNKYQINGLIRETH